MITYELVRFIALYYSLHFVDGAVKFRGNGYEDIVVAISEEVEEDMRIIENIKQMFIDGSDSLYTATRAHTFFREVSIVVPSTWTQMDEYENATDAGEEWTAQGDIVVDKASPIYGDNPYTLQLGECGDPGEFIHLTPDYVTNMYESDRITRQGPPGKMLVHEWAHLRWGVFDEYGDVFNKAPNFYIGEDLQLHVTGCTSDIEGWIRTPDGGNCSADSTGKPDANCIFFPANNSHVRGSLMNMHFLSSVNSFCDDDEVGHNPWAPNRQNIMCQRKSVWTVIQEHPDFRDFNRSSSDFGTHRSRREMSSEATTPIFRLRQVRKVDSSPRFVLLVDLSPSMEGYMKDLWQSTVIFVRDFLPEWSMLSVISFSNTAKIDVEFTNINERNRMFIVKRLPKEHHKDGNTAIGEALKFTLETAIKEGVSTKGLNVILITDGEETVYPTVASVMPRIKEAGIVLNTFAYGHYATNNLEGWAKATGGRSYYFNPENFNSATRFYSLLYDSVSKDIPKRNKFLQVTSRFSLLEKRVEGEVRIDSNVGLETRFIFMERLSFHPQNTFSLEAELASPGGRVTYGPANASDIYQVDNDTRTITIFIKHAEAGVWNYTLKNKQNIKDEVCVDVTSRPTLKEEPIMANSWVSKEKVNFPARMRVYTRVTRGNHPVLRAVVTAIVEPSSPSSPSSRRIVLWLRDDGKEGDFQKGDGIYTAVFTQFSGNGRYGVSVSVETTNATSILMGHPGMYTRRNGAVSGTLQRPYLPLPEEEMPEPATEFLPTDLLPPEEVEVVTPSPSSPPPTSVPEIALAEPFTRISSASFFKVEHYQDGDFLPPASVMDLSVKSVSLQHATVTLSWTSSGDDHYLGTASAIDLRFHKTTSIYNDFESANVVTKESLSKGSLVPIPGGKKHMVTIKLVEYEEDLEGHVVYFAVKTVDDEGTKSGISNVATAYFPLAKYDKKRRLMAAKEINSWTGLVVLVALVIIIIIIVAFVVTVKVMHARRRQREDQHSMA
ncbi:calcium-activated chloride channel regulator 1-like [Oratosquilla oratoria]|uniref:calcium-activated chloride channel regulator 1-like n=1 Tax=Oratosquilla oratoria TaxID=337810 RepID=UPI003F75B848